LKKLVIILSPLILIVCGIIFHFLTQKTDKPADKDFPEIVQEGTLHIVTNFDPIGYYVSSDTISGYNYDLIQYIKQYTPLKFEIHVENSLEKSFEGLKNGEYDVIARNIPINSNLKNEYNFTEPTVYNKLILVQRKAEYNDSIAPIRNHLDLGGKTIHVAKGSPSIFRLQNLSHELGDTIHIIENDLYEANQLILMVAGGTIDLTVSDIETAQNIAGQLPELDIETDIGFTHLEGWAVRSNSHILLDSLNNWIARLKKSDQYKIMQSKYYQ